MLDTLKKTFSLEKLSPNHDRPIVFILCQWQKQCNRPNLIYLIYRWILALLFVITLIISAMDLKHPDCDAAFKAKWLIYLTHWGYMMCTIQFLISAIMVTLYYYGTDNIKNISLKFYKIYWITNTISTVIAFGITTIYWSLIYDEKTMDLNALNLLFHVNNSIVVIIDLFITSHPIRLLHFCYPVIFGMCYCIFSIIFYLAGGISREGHKYIYNILDWSKPGRTSIVVLIVIGYVIIIHILMWALYKLRVWIYNKTMGDNTNQCDITIMDNKDQQKQQEQSDVKNYYYNEALSADV